MHADDLAVPVALAAGRHTIQVELGLLAGELGLALRFVDANFTPWSELRIQPVLAVGEALAEAPQPEVQRALASLQLERVRPMARGFDLELLVGPGMVEEGSAAPREALLDCSLRLQPEGGEPEQHWTLPSLGLPLPGPDGRRRPPRPPDGAASDSAGDTASSSTAGSSPWVGRIHRQL
ncbi:MAG: hypothetical protein FJ125_17270, partial [Deltaproteobacteria bacterium]|nr:hypothetical protein [Deltaproteobacteria bacterium]